LLPHPVLHDFVDRLVTFRFKWVMSKSQGSMFLCNEVCFRLPADGLAVDFKEDTFLEVFSLQYFIVLYFDFKFFNTSVGFIPSQKIRCFLIFLTRLNKVRLNAKIINGRCKL
jgi:hypothetical protein